MYLGRYLPYIYKEKGKKSRTNILNKSKSNWVRQTNKSTSPNRHGVLILMYLPFGNQEWGRIWGDVKLRTGQYYIKLRTGQHHWT